MRCHQSVCIAVRSLLLGVLLSFGTYAHAQFNPPTGVGAAGVSTSQIAVWWNPVTAYQYHIYRYGALIATVGGGVTSFTDGGLPQGSTYCYQVRVQVGKVGSPLSASACGTTLALPAGPTGLGAAASGAQITLAWSDASGNESGFRIQRKTGSGGTYSQIATVGANATSYGDSTASAETVYYYRVIAYNSGGDSGASNEASAAILAAPTGLSAAAVASGQINLAWTDNSGYESGTKIERKTGAGGTYAQIASVGANTVSYSDAGLTAGTYYYRLRATNSTGDSSYSSEASVGLTLPNAPSGLAATDMASGQIRLTWTDNSDAETGIKVERKTGAGGTYAQIAALGVNATSYDDGTVSPGNTYYYRVRSTNFAGDSAYSNEASISATAPNVTAGTLTYKYDPFGNLVETNAGGAVTTISYDIRGRKTAMSDPDMGNWVYAYNIFGELVRQTDAKGNVSTVQYDVLGRMTTRTELDLVSTWTYDGCAKGVGKLCQASADNGYQRVHGYDAFGRPSTVTTTIDAAYTVTTSYDGYGRADRTTYPTGFATQNIYNAYGHLASIRNADAPSTVYWAANAVSALGRVTSETLGNTLTTSRTFNTLGRLIAISATGTGGTVQSNTYAYDSIGNLTQRVDVTQSVTENFAYDSLNRLISSSGSGLPTKAYDYDALGNIVYRSGFGTYTYGAKPHAVTSVSGVFNATYQYDANGNMTTGNGRTITYTSYNMPSAVAATGLSYAFTYSPEHERVRLIHSVQGTEIYLNAGSSPFYEKNIKPGGLVEHKHYVAGVAVYISRSDATSETRYFHKDHLGSTELITSASGAVLERLAYEAFGKRRFANGSDDPGNTIVNTERGFTGHKHMDDVELIHMNGRIYDPVIARFVTADPFIQSPGSLQSYNRYTYASNNPLRRIDPSGYNDLEDFFHDPGKTLVKWGDSLFFNHPDLVFGAVFTAATWGAFSPMAMGGGGLAAEFGVYSGWATAGATGFAWGYSSSGGDLNAGLQSAFTSLLFYGAGEFGAKFPGLENRIMAHALAGCISGAAGGGSCGKGALAAGFAEAALGLTGQDIKHPVGRFAVAVAVGGTASVLGGGKFGNGAATAAFGYLFNHWAHELEIAFYGQDAHKALQAEMQKYGYAVESSCVNGKCVDGRFDIADGSTNELWEIKHDSPVGTELGRRAIAAYTDGTAFRPGGDLTGLPIGGAMILSGQHQTYSYFNLGGGLVVWRQDTVFQRIRIPNLYPFGYPRGGKDPMFEY